MTVPYFTLTRQTKPFKNKILKRLARVMDSGHFILGREVEAFERQFSAYCKTRYAVGVASGTDALTLALRALDVGKGDEVLVPSYTYAATVFAILNLQAVPKFIDIEESTFCLDPLLLEAAVSKKTKAILPVHLYGQAANMSAIQKCAHRHELRVIEDAAQAHGATWQNKPVGSWGDAGCFSFYPTKNLGAFGDGGAITVKNSKWVKRLKQLRNLGHISFRDDHQELGWNSRLDEIQAVILQEKLPYLERFNQQRIQAAHYYREKLSTTPLIFHQEMPGSRHVYHLAVVRVPEGRRDALQAFLQKQGIVTLIHYEKPSHRQPAIAKHLKTKPHLPVSERVCKEILVLPLFPEIKLKEQECVCRAIKQFYGIRK